MTRYSRKAGDEVPDKHSDNARRRTAPRVEGMPLSPKAISDIYRKGKTITQPHDPEHQPPQFAEDAHGPGYHNDTSGWVRSKGEDSTRDRPGGFDHGKLDISNKPDRRAAGGSPNTASGQDMKSSPFSAAHRTYSED